MRRIAIFALTFLGFMASISIGGCAQPPSTGIAQIDPYLGARPEPIPALPEKPKIKKQEPRLAGAEAGWVPSKGISKRWNCIVVHHSANDKSTPEGMREWHVKGRGWDELGYHFVIGNGIGYADGKVYVGQRWTKQMHGAHCKTPGNRYNEHGVGICLIGNLDRHGPTKKQIQALAKLTSFLSGRCNIPRSQVLTHGGITHKTACPGKHFSLKPVLEQMTLQHRSASATQEWPYPIEAPPYASIPRPTASTSPHSRFAVQNSPFSPHRLITAKLTGTQDP